MGQTDPADRYENRVAPVQPGSLRRGLHLLTCLGREGAPLGLSELAQRSGLDKATVHRLTRVLVEAGYLTQDPATRSYTLGLRILDLGFATLARLGVRELSLPYMRELAEQFTGASVSLSVLDRGETLYIERISQRRISVNVDVHVGTRIPVHCSSMGKALLAALPVDESADLIGRQSLEPWTPRTITSLPRLTADLERIRSLGYAINDEETALGLRSVAVAVIDAAGRPAAAVNVAVSAAEVSVQQLECDVAPAVLAAGAAISRHLGRLEPPAPDGRDEPRRTGAVSR
jgi:IclR family pca regulon transcriptional regulator